MPPRRALLAWLAGGGLAMRARAQAQAVPRPLDFPRDHGAHPAFGIEWWYVTGWLDTGSAATRPAYGFQLTFFRSRTGLAQAIESRFSARQLLFAHAALSDVGAQRLVHAERIARWNEAPDARQAAAALDDTRVHVGAWRLERGDAGYAASWQDDAAGFALDLALEATQPLLLQGDAGFSRKGPQPDNASHYYSQVQLDVHGRLRDASTAEPVATPVTGRAWLDHEWSGTLMPTDAVGWDWIGINLDDGSALTAFRLRDARGSAVHAGGSHRARGGAPRAFGPEEVAFEPLHRWTSPATRAAYPVHWRVRTPVGAFEVRAAFEAQELDARLSTGSIYWEGLASLHRTADGHRVGWGYLEMTGYAAPLRL
jgi:predicted secreted hydrolase